MNHDFLTANFDERRATKNGSCWWLKRGVGGRRRVDYSIFGNVSDIRRRTKTHGNKVLKSRSTIPKSERKEEKGENFYTTQQRQLQIFVKKKQARGSGTLLFCHCGGCHQM